MKIVLVIISTLIVWVTQGLGYTGTCTQGDIGAFMTGVVFSAPFILVSLFILIRLPNNELRELCFVSSVITLIIAFGIISMNAKMGIEVFIYGGSPCGPDYQLYSESNYIENKVIGISYVIMPIIIAAKSAHNIFKNIKPVPAG